MKTIVMSELPGPCNLDCPYCYVPDSVKSSPYREASTEDWMTLAEKFDEPFFWMCGAGEPLLREDVYLATYQLATFGYKVGLVTNLATETAGVLTKAMKESTLKDNIALYVSIHWLEWGSLGDAMRNRIKSAVESGIKLWPTMVMHPSYYDVIDDVLEFVKSVGLKLIPTRYRVDQGPLANIDYTELEKILRESEYTDMRLWDATPNCWDVRGGTCTAGLNQIIIDAYYNICTCHGNGNKRILGKFPEDVCKIEQQEPQVCNSDFCPCKHSVMWGVNSKFNYTFASMLSDWESYVG